MKLRLTAGLVFFLSLFLFACVEKIPVKEFTKAKEAIDLASSVKADQYSPEEYKAAIDLLMKAHETLIKDEKLDDSIQNSEQAYAKAMDAYNKSAVLYAADSLKKADDAIAAADKVYAEKLSPELFGQAKELYTKANEQFEGKNYKDTCTASEEAYTKAVKAKEESLDNKYQLQVKIDEVNAILAKVEQYDYEEYSGEKYNIAKSKTGEAENSYNSDELKAGFEAVETAKINADEAYKATMEGVTAKKLAEAESVVKEAENSSGAAVAEEDLAAAKEALNNAMSLKDSGNYEESITYSNEAIRLGNNVIEEGKKAAVAANVKNQKKDDDKSDKTDAGKGKTSAKTGFVEEDENYWYFKVRSWEKYEDCLSKIAEKYYKNAKAWKGIQKANSSIKNPDLIRPGQIIRVPKVRK